jgi:RsiW-degrading membrane proteinase PrsW (M82 family)
MGLIREFYSEIFALPKAAEIKFDSKKDITILHYKIKYSCVNLFFQIIDCVVIPVIFFNLFHGINNVWILIVTVILGLSSLFSLSQFFYYLLRPTNNYVSLIYLLLGETALGIFFASIFNLSIKHYNK